MTEFQRRILIAVIIVALVGVTVFQLSKNNRLNLPRFNPSSITTQNETRTVVSEENAVIDVVEKSSSSVIAIGVTQRIFNPFDPFSIPRSRESTIGTGFVVDGGKGVIVTNRHVVSDQNLKYSVVTKDGKKLDVERIYRDPNLDLAIVQVAGSSELKSIELGDSSNLKVGQTMIAIGNALGRFDNTVTTGVVSGLGRSIGAGDPFTGEAELLDDLIQTDAAINPGNSGGPILNSAGQVVGVNVATTEGAQNIGFAIPINAIKPILEEFVTNGKISRPYLGIRYRLITRDLAILNEVPQGAYIQEVLGDSPAEKAGIKTGDIVTKIDGQQINTDTKISDMIQQRKPGDSLSLEVWTDGQTRTVNVTLQESPNQ
jgi:serine protease Do